MPFVFLSSLGLADASETLVAVVLFVGAVLGHFLLAIGLHNWLYGLGLPRRLVHVLQLIIGLVLLTGPILLVVLAHGYDLRPLLDVSFHDPGQFLLTGYLGFCWVTAFVVFPR